MINKPYKLKIKTLSPIHIGTGEFYTPTNFVIDSGTLYEFDEYSFYNKLDPALKKEFLKIVESKDKNPLQKIHNFIKQNQMFAIKSSSFKVDVASGIQEDYLQKAGKVVQVEGGRKTPKKDIINQFQIARTTRDMNTSQVYIPGSSIKGSISTAYQEYIYKKDYNLWRECFQRPDDTIFRNLSVSDTLNIKSNSKIGFALNKERFEDEADGPSNKLEIITAQSEFEVSLDIKNFKLKEQVDIKTLQNSCNEHYYPLFKSMFKRKNLLKDRLEDDYIIDYFSEEFYERYKNFTLEENQFLLRIGKYSGARAVSIDGMRKIKVKESGGGPKRKPNRWEETQEETTTWLFGEDEQDIDTLLPFGWVVCEEI